MFRVLGIYNFGLKANSEKELKEDVGMLLELDCKDLDLEFRISRQLSLVKIISLTFSVALTFLPCLVNVVCERPLAQCSCTYIPTKIVERDKNSHRHDRKKELRI